MTGSGTFVLITAGRAGASSQATQVRSIPARLSMLVKDGCAEEERGEERAGWGQGKGESPREKVVKMQVESGRKGGREERSWGQGQGPSQTGETI